MKVSILSIIILLLFNINCIIAQEITTKVYLIKNQNTYNLLVNPDNPITIAELSLYNHHQNSIALLDFNSVKENPKASRMRGEDDNYIYVTFENEEGDLLTLSQAAVSSVKISSASTDEYVINDMPDPSYDAEKKYYSFPLIFLDKEPSDGEILTVEVNFLSGKVEMVNFKYWNTFKLYNTLGLGRTGFWIPTNIYSVSVSGNSLISQVAPIGVAWGGKLSLGNRGQIQVGVSLAASYTVSRSDVNNNLNVSDISVGAIFEFWDIFSAGVMVPTSISKNDADQNAYFVIGIAPKLKSILGGSDN